VPPGPVVVAGAGISGVACARALLAQGIDVIVLDRRESVALDELAAAGARPVVADGVPDGLLDGASAVVVSPGFRPDHPLPVAAAARGLEVYSEPELAWRLGRQVWGGGAPPWLGVTGTNGKTTTVTQLAAMLAAGGLRTVAVGNVGRPLIDAVLATADGCPAYDVLAVELSSFQLHWSLRLAPVAAVLLNLADDHLDWHGGFEEYARIKTAVWRGARTAVGNADDPRVAALLAGAPGRHVGFTLGPPAAGQLGIADGTLVDRTGPEPVGLAATELVRPPGSHNVANALAAAALARAYGVTPESVAGGLRGYVPERHRNALVRSVGGVAWVDDSKATNPHAAAASLGAYPRIVWVAGGLLKGVDVDALVAAAVPRLVGAVLLGAERDRIAASLARHAPALPVVDVARTDDGAMTDVVTAAARLARPGDTVLLAPAAASMDMFGDYGHRGDAFAAAVAALPDADPPGGPP
jgi:UDP-N-acetylmuramoylalanine--D-glutamate ligase